MKSANFRNYRRYWCRLNISPSSEEHFDALRGQSTSRDFVVGFHNAATNTTALRVLVCDCSAPWQQLFRRVRISSLERTRLAAITVGTRPRLGWTELIRDYSSSRKAEINASWGTSTRPIFFIRFFPSFCFSSSFLFLVMSPP